MKQTPLKAVSAFPKKLFVPPMWVTMLLCFAGIYGMNLVYRALTQGGSWMGAIGAILLASCVYAVGTPLAAAYVMKRQVKKNSHVGG